MNKHRLRKSLALLVAVIAVHYESLLTTGVWAAVLWSGWATWRYLDGPYWANVRAIQDRK